MTDDELRSTIDAGDVARLREILTADPQAVNRAFWWGDPRGGGDYTQAISYVSLARFHGLADHDRMGEIAQLLVGVGAPPDGPPDAAETPIVTAASYDEAGVAAALVAAGADPIGRGFAAPGGSALAHAVFFGNPTVAEVILGAGASLTTLAEAAGTGRLEPRRLQSAAPAERAEALRAAAVCDQVEVIDQILAADVPVDVEVDGATALHHAAFHGKAAAVRRLVERGADPTRQDPTHHAPPLGWARFRHHELFRPSPGHDAVEHYLHSATASRRPAGS